MSIFWYTGLASTLLLGVCSVCTAADDSFRSGFRLSRSVELRSAESPIKVIGTRAIYSQYDESGNRLDITAFDATSGDLTKLVGGVARATFVAMDDRYIVYSRSAPNTNPIVVLDRRTGVVLRELRIRLPVSSGHIAGNRLIAFQGANAVLFELPSLKVLHEKELPSQQVAISDNLILVMGSKISLYDFEFHERGEITLPSERKDSGLSCFGGPIRIFGGKAIVKANCDQFAVIDLDARRVEKVIGTFSIGHSIAVGKGLLFAVATGQDKQSADLRVIDLASGYDLAVLPIDADQIEWVDGKLVTFRNVQSQKQPFKRALSVRAYELDFPLITSGAYAENRVAAECKFDGRSAETASQDGYAMILRCEAAGMRGILQRDSRGAQVQPAMALYATLLANTYTRYEEAAPILSRLMSRQSSDLLQKAHLRTQRKAAFFSMANREQAKSSAFGAGVRVATLNPDGLNDRTVFQGNRAYVGRYECAGGEGDSSWVMLDILNRHDLSRHAEIPIVKCDSDQQDAIVEIVPISRYVVVSLEYRYQDPRRTNLAILNAETLLIERRAHLPEGMQGIVEWKGRLLRCSFRSNEPHTRFDFSTAKLVSALPEESRACLNGEGVPVTKTHGDQLAALGASSNYDIYDVPSGALSTYKLVHRSERNVKQISLPQGRWQYRGALSGEDRILLSEAFRDKQRFGIYDIRSDRFSTIFDVVAEPNQGGIAGVWKNYALIASGRDLILYDAAKMRVVKYALEFVAEGFKSNGYGRDLHAIRQLIVDGDRMFVVTSTGKNSRIVDLKAYTGELPPQQLFDE